MIKIIDLLPPWLFALVITFIFSAGFVYAIRDGENTKDGNKS